MIQLIRLIYLHTNDKNKYYVINVVDNNFSISPIETKKNTFKPKKIQMSINSSNSSGVIDSIFWIYSFTENV